MAKLVKTAHKRISHRRVVTLKELADYYHVHRHTIRKMVNKNKVDLRDPFSLFDFAVKINWRKEAVAQHLFKSETDSAGYQGKYHHMTIIPKLPNYGGPPGLSDIYMDGVLIRPKWKGPDNFWVRI